MQPLLQTLGTARNLGADIRILPMSATWAGSNTHGLTDADYAVAAQARDDGAIWLFSSSECVANLAALTRSTPLAVQQDEPHSQWTGSVAVATHPRIARAARDVGFGTVHLSRPGLADVLASIESFP